MAHLERRKADERDAHYHHADTQNIKHDPVAGEQPQDHQHSREGRREAGGGGAAREQPGDGARRAQPRVLGDVDGAWPAVCQKVVEAEGGGTERDEDYVEDEKALRVLELRRGRGWVGGGG